MPSEYVPAYLKRLVFDRAKGACEYCRSPSKFAVDPFVMEHTHPLSRGGKTISENLALSCHTCNNCKYNKITVIDPITNQIVPIFNPRQMKWSDHFTWTPDTTKMLGLTPTGRATIESLQTNREGVVNIRRILSVSGEHPPLDE
jgi:HNH endonuclease